MEMGGSDSDSGHSDHLTEGMYLHASQQLEGGCREFVSFPLTLLARIPALHHRHVGTQLWPHAGEEGGVTAEEEVVEMRTVVALTRCQGYAQCVFLAPEVFELHGEEGLLYATAVPDDQVERVRQAAAACPVQAILLGEEVSTGAR